MAPRPTPTSATTDAPTDQPDLPVRARWVDTQAVFVPSQGLVRYGDEIWVTPEQLAAPGQPTIPWSDDWVADDTLAAIALKEG